MPQSRATAAASAASPTSTAIAITRTPSRFQPLEARRSTGPSARPGEELPGRAGPFLRAPEDEAAPDAVPQVRRLGEGDRDRTRRVVLEEHGVLGTHVDGRRLEVVVVDEDRLRSVLRVRAERLLDGRDAARPGDESEDGGGSEA